MRHWTANVLNLHWEVVRMCRWFGEEEKGLVGRSSMLLIDED